MRKSRLFEEVLIGYRGQRGDDPDFDYFSKPRKNRHDDKKGMIGKWYSDNPDVAATYGKKQYEAEIEAKDPLEVDAEGNYWDEFSIPAVEGEKGSYQVQHLDGTSETVKNTDTNKLAKEAKKDGHDVLVVKNVVDLGHSYGNEKSHEPSTDIAVLKPEAIVSEKLVESFLSR